MVRSRWAVPVALAVVLLTGCGDDKPQNLPEIGASASATGATAASGLNAEQQAVVDRVDLYERTLDAIAAGDKLDMKRVRAVAVDSWAQVVGEGLQQTKAQDFVVTGTTEREFKSVAVSGGQARFSECVDARKTRLV